MFLSTPVTKPVTVDGVPSASQVMEVRTTLPCLSSGSAGMSQEINTFLEVAAYSVTLVGGPANYRNLRDP